MTLACILDALQCYVRTRQRCDDGEQVLLMPRSEDQSRTQPAELAQPIVRDVRDNQYWHVDYD